MPNQIKRRATAVEKNIAQIQPDKDIRVRLIGTVIDVKENSLVIDDGSGKVEILFDQPELIAGITPGQLVRVITRILPLIDGYECRAECVQNLENFDIDLYKRAEEINIR